MREHKSKLFKTQSGLYWCLMASLDRFAPNGVVRRQVRKADERYRRLFGEPTLTMKAVSKVVESRVIGFKIKEAYDPLNRHPKEEPFKKYIYDKNGKSDDVVPYRTETPRRSLKTLARMTSYDLQFDFYENLVKIARILGRGSTHKDIDDYVEDKIKRRSFTGF